jgi:hypothetical protein
MLVPSKDIPQRVLRFCVLLGLDRAATVAWMVEHPDAMRYCGETVDPEDELARVQVRAVIMGASRRQHVRSFRQAAAAWLAGCCLACHGAGVGRLLWG